MTNSTTEAVNSRTCPKRRVSQPVSGSEMALATPKEVMTQVPWSGETPRSPAMAGSDTLAIEVSSTFMKVASDSAIVPMTSVRADQRLQSRPAPRRERRRSPVCQDPGRHGCAARHALLSQMQRVGCGGGRPPAAAAGARCERQCPRRLRLVGRDDSLHPRIGRAHRSPRTPAWTSCGGARQLRQARIPLPRSCTSTSAFIDRPICSGWLAISRGSSAMRTGTRCTILIQLPVAFCAGSSEKAEPVPAPKPATLP